MISIKAARTRWRLNINAQPDATGQPIDKIISTIEIKAGNWSEESDSEPTSCGGNFAACLGGPARDYLGSDLINNGINHIIKNSFGGVSEEISLSTDATVASKHLANFSCRRLMLV